MLHIFQLKLIRMTDSNELGWHMVHKYKSNPLADISDDERRMYRAEAMASRKLKAERSKKTKQFRSTSYRRVDSQPSTTTATSTTSSKPGLCFQCGKAGHWKKERPGSFNNKMSIDLNYYSMKHFNPKAVSSTESSTENNVVSNVGTGSSQYCSPVGRLKSKAERWKSANASAYIYEVVCLGYKIPFKTLPSPTSLKNNKSARANPQFVKQEIKSLLDKNVISQVEDKAHVVNPLSVAYSRKGKPRLVLDCRNINRNLHLFNIKFEDTKVAESLFGKGSFSVYFQIQIIGHTWDFLGA